MKATPKQSDSIVSDKMFEIVVTLCHIEPKVWRRIAVPASATFWDLHVAIQDAMGWLDCHLHAFRVRDGKTRRGVEIGIPDPDAFVGSVVALPGWKVPMAKHFSRPGDRADYEYDFGDGWHHDVVLEAIEERPPNTELPKCLDGARACPPEDCGGSGGYAELLRVLNDRADEEHDSMLEWVGGHFDSEEFDPKRVCFGDPEKRLRMMLED